MSSSFVKNPGNLQNLFNDIKDKTVTGAMPFAGGPLNSYVLHSTAKLIEKLRENNGVGIVTGVSGMMTKQSYALWSKNPCIDFRYEDCLGQILFNYSSETSVPSIASASSNSKLDSISSFSA